jgi:hypothetical protein
MPPGREPGKPATNRLSYGMALLLFNIHDVESEIMVPWVMARCSFTDDYQHSGENCCLHFQCRSEMEAAGYETMVTTSKITQYHNPGNHNLN